MLCAIHAPVWAGLSGTKTVGPTGDYASLGAAFTAITGGGLDDALILELQAAYVSTVETFPLTAGAFPGSSSSSTVTIRPEASATGRSITSNGATGTFDLNGATYVIIDGRPGGGGTSKELTIENTNAAGFALRHINEARFNTTRYVVIKGVNTSAGSGVVVFGTTTGANGNDGNTIDTCDIRDGSTTPTNLVHSLGTNTTPPQNNSGNTISGCNIFNFFNSALNHTGVMLGQGNQDWTIRGNSFYETASRVMGGTGTLEWNAISSTSNTVNNIQILDNYFGGSAPQCGGSAMTYSGNATIRATRLTVGNTTPSSLQGNTFQNISVTSTSASSSQMLIGLTSGSFNVGTVTPNVIGSQSATGNISFSLSNTSTAAFAAILAGTGTPGTIVISNNLIGGIAISGISGVGTPTARGISIQSTSGSGTYTVSHNTIGSPTMANSFTSSANGTMIGIYGATTATNTITATITGNRIINLAYLGTGTGASQLIGISGTTGTGGGVYTITENTVRNFDSSSASALTGTTASVIGISLTANVTAGQVVSRNIIHSLSNSASTAATCVTGLHYSGPTTGTNLVSRNFVHSLSLATSGINTTPGVSQLTGININGGLTEYTNNMIRLGLDAAGTSITTGYPIAGINEGVGTDGIFGNSVYVGGSGVAANQNTFALQSSVSINTRSYKDNILVNARSNSSGAAKNYAVRYGSIDAGHTSDYNDLYVSGTGGVVGATGSGAMIVDYATLNAWQVGTGRDLNSRSVDPLLVNAAGDASTVDLHIDTSVFPASPVANAGTTLNSLAVDFDGETRGPAPDIGADDFVNYTITAATGANGTINPIGSLLANAGSDAMFAMIPAPCYQVADIVVDDSSTGPAPGYTFYDVQSDHTISVSFVLQTFTIQATAGPGGSISPAGNVVVNCGDGQEFQITPDLCHDILDVVVDGESQGPVPTYAFSDVRTDHTIAASFSPKTFIIAASAGAGGSINPSGNVVVNCGESQEFLIGPNPCYRILDVVVDNLSQGPLSSYTFSDVHANHSIVATFAVRMVTLTRLVVGSGMLLVVPDQPSYPCGTPVAITAFAAAGWQFDHWEGSAAGNDNPLFLIMDDDKTITGVFVDIAPPDVHLTAPDGGEVWYVGSTQAVTWTATDNVGVTGVDLHYSMDGGATYPFEIATGVANTGSYDWLIPDTICLTARVRVTAHDAAANLASDDSDADFEIRSDLSAVAATLLSNGQILGVYPNPAGAGEAHVIYKLPASGIVDLGIYDIRGRLIRTLASGSMAGGIRAVRWDGLDDGGSPVPHGIYWVRFASSPGLRAARQLVYLRQP
jgi:hypothetical protein